MRVRAGNQGGQVGSTPLRPGALAAAQIEGWGAWPRAIAPESLGVQRRIGILNSYPGTLGSDSTKFMSEATGQSQGAVEMAVTASGCVPKSQIHLLQKQHLSLPLPCVWVYCLFLLLFWGSVAVPMGAFSPIQSEVSLVVIGLESLWGGCFSWRIFPASLRYTGSVLSTGLLFGGHGEMLVGGVSKSGC